MTHNLLENIISTLSTKVWRLRCCCTFNDIIFGMLFLKRNILFDLTTCIQ